MVAETKRGRSNGYLLRGRSRVLGWGGVGWGASHGKSSPFHVALPSRIGFYINFTYVYDIIIDIMYCSFVEKVSHNFDACAMYTVRQINRRTLGTCTDFTAYAIRH